MTLTAIVPPTKIGNASSYGLHDSSNIL